MPETQSLIATSSDRYVRQTVDFLDSIFANYPRTDFAFRLWDGTVWQKKDADPARFTIVLNHAASIRRMFLPPSDTRLGMAYTLGDFEIEGDAGKALNLGRHLWESWGWMDTLRNAYKLIRLPASPISAGNVGIGEQPTGALHSESRDKRAIQFHYDVGNEFYELWLDKRMVYSCAYFASPDESIDTAQERKLDYICRKLRLREGDRLLDIGCGWGALVIHATKHYGVQALGVTLSEGQLKLARENVKQAGVSESCKIELLDYRNVDETQPFDKIVSVGMVEHVGRQNLGMYFEKAWRLLRPGGVMLNHGITLLHDEFKSVRAMRQGFFGKYIFPDGDIQPLQYILPFATKTGFEVRDIESLREHYALTLNCWRARFEKHEKEIVKMVGTHTYRLWRLYLIGASWGFDNGLHSIYQTLLFKAGESGSGTPELPLQRSDWYKDEGTNEQA